MSEHIWKEEYSLYKFVSLKTGISNATVFYKNGEWKWYATCICGNHTYNGCPSGSCSSFKDAQNMVTLQFAVERWE
jgi:hypothetical protein